MENNIIKFRDKNAAKDPDHVLEKAKGEYRDVIILGWTKDDYMGVRASYGMTTKEMVFLIDQFKHNLLDGKYNE